MTETISFTNRNKCPICGEKMLRHHKDVYKCPTHGEFIRETIKIVAFKWLNENPE